MPNSHIKVYMHTRMHAFVCACALYCAKPFIAGITHVLGCFQSRNKDINRRIKYTATTLPAGLLNSYYRCYSVADYVALATKATSHIYIVSIEYTNFMGDV